MLSRIVRDIVKLWLLPIIAPFHSEVRPKRLYVLSFSHTTRFRQQQSTKSTNYGLIVNPAKSVRTINKDAALGFHGTYAPCTTTTFCSFHSPWHLETGRLCIIFHCTWNGISRTALKSKQAQPISITHLRKPVCGDHCRRPSMRNFSKWVRKKMNSNPSRNKHSEAYNGIFISASRKSPRQLQTTLSGAVPIIYLERTHRFTVDNHN